MKWWKKALVCSAVWFCLMLGIAILDTSVIRAGTLTHEQDERLSSLYGGICGAGLTALWLYLYLAHKRSR